MVRLSLALATTPGSPSRHRARVGLYVWVAVVIAGCEINAGGSGRASGDAALRPDTGPEQAEGGVGPSRSDARLPPGDGGRPDRGPEADSEPSTDAATTSDGSVAVDIGVPREDASPTPDAAPPVDVGPERLDSTPDLGAEPDAEAPDAPVYSGDAPVFQQGPLRVRMVDIHPREVGYALRIFAPDAEADPFPVVFHQHGFLMSQHYYNDVLTHLASHGFIVVAPQMYPPDDFPIGKPTVAVEAAAAGGLYDTVPGRLSEWVAARAATGRIGLVGHSRGAKAAWLALREDPRRARAIAGIDPVDGQGGPGGNEPRLIDGPLGLAQPALVIGAGRGAEGLIPCAPEGDNHTRFYEASGSPAWHALAERAGHNDVLGNQAVCLACIQCPGLGANQRERFRRTVAGLLVAFFRGTLQDGRAEDLVWLRTAEDAPVDLELEHK